jgi:hypothetical protein
LLSEEAKVMEGGLLAVCSRGKMLSIGAAFCVWRAALKTEIRLIYV